MTNVDAIASEMVGAPVSVGDSGVIAVLERTLAAARAGRVRGLALIQVTGAGQLGMEVAGGPLPEMVAGTVQLGKLLTDQMFAPRGGGSRLLVPGRG